MHNYLTPKDIRDLTGASPQGVNNWQRRNDDFPEPVSHAGRTPLFDRDAVLDWLEKNGKLLNNSDSNNLQVEQLSTAFREAVKAVRPDEILKKVVLPSLNGSGEHRLSQELSKATAETSGDNVANIVVDLISRLPGKVGADYDIPNPLRRLFEIVADPQSGISTYDGCGGLGTLLAKITPKDGRAYMQEVDAEAVDTAKALFALRKKEVAVAVGDTLLWDGHPDVRVDRVIMAPPANLTVREINTDDPRWEYGGSTRPSATELWLQIALAHTNSHGKAVVQVPSRDVESPRQTLLATLIKLNVLDAVIHVGNGVLGGSNIASCLIVLDKDRPSSMVEHTPILIADISSGNENRTERRLTNSMVERFEREIWRNWRANRVEMDSEIAVAVSLPRIRESKFDLRLDSYVRRHEWPELSQAEAEKEFDRLSESIRLTNIDPGVVIQPPRLLNVNRTHAKTLRDLHRQHALQLVKGVTVNRRPTRSDVDERLEMPVQTPTISVDGITSNLLDVIEVDIGEAVGSSNRGDTPASRHHAKVGDILISSYWPEGNRPIVGVATQNQDGVRLDGSVYGLRLEPESSGLIDRRYFQWWIATPRFVEHLARSASHGSFRNRLSAKTLLEFELPLPSVNEQQELVRKLDNALRFVREKEAAHRQIVSDYRAMEGLLIEFFGITHK